MQGKITKTGIDALIAKAKPEQATVFLSLG